MIWLSIFTDCGFPILDGIMSLSHEIKVRFEFKFCTNIVQPGPTILVWINRVFKLSRQMLVKSTINRPYNYFQVI